jgi:hypothetical protein
MSRNTKGRLDLHEMVEERLGEFGERVSKIEERMSEIEDKTRKSFDKYIEYVESLSAVVAYDIFIMGWIADLDICPAGNTSLFDDVVEGIKEKRKASKRIEELGLKAHRIAVESQIKEVIRIARKWGIPFEDIASYLIGSLGKEEARIIVQKEDLMAWYRKEIIPIWESLLKE